MFFFLYYIAEKTDTFDSSVWT